MRPDRRGGNPRLPEKLVSEHEANETRSSIGRSSEKISRLVSKTMRRHWKTHGGLEVTIG